MHTLARFLVYYTHTPERPQDGHQVHARHSTVFRYNDSNHFATFAASDG